LNSKEEEEEKEEEEQEQEKNEPRSRTAAVRVEPRHILHHVLRPTETHLSSFQM
jgi:hypothetical protein